MAKNIIRHSGVIVVGTFASDPSGMPDGSMYYNSTSQKIRILQNGTFSDANSVTPNFADNTFRIQDNGDATKQIAFEASGIATATTRTVTMPDANVNLGLVATAIQSSEKGSAGGVATLDGGGKVPVSQLPNSIMEYQGTWNASTNSPTLVDGTGNTGDVYRVSVAGSQDLGSGSISFGVGDYAIYNGATWEKADTTDAVSSVNGFTGAVTLTTTNVSEGTNLYFTNARAIAATLTGYTAGTGVVTSADTVLSALQKIDANTNAKLSTVSQDTTPQLGGDLDLNGKAVMGTMDRSAVGSPTNFVEEQYIHATTLAGSSSGVTASAFNFAHATFQGCELTYSIKEATTNRVRIGTLRVATDGTNIGISDSFSESADCDVAWDAVINGANVELKYTTANANAKVMRTDVKRFKV